MSFYKIESASGELYAVAPRGTVDEAFDSFCRTQDAEPLVTRIERDEYETLKLLMEART